MIVENLIREREMEITIDGKVNGLEEERSYIEKKASARELELAEFKLDEIRERISRLKELLQKQIKRCGLLGNWKKGI